MMKIIYILSLLFWGIPASFSQTQVNNRIPATTDVLVMVKQYDEFVKRFNADDAYMAALAGKIGSDIDWKENRYKFIGGLMDLEKSLENKEILQFARFVQDRGLKINQAKDTYAEARVVFDAKGKPQEWTLRLKMEGNNEQGWKWVITDATSPTLKYAAKKDTVQISPLDNEVDFMGLSEVLGGNYQAYTPKGYRPDGLSVFLYLAGSGQMTYKNTAAVIYHQKLGGYRFLVQEIHREDSPRHGYLITSLTDPDGKKIF